MKSFYQIKNKSHSSIPTLIIGTIILSGALITSGVYAGEPAATASCSGIKAAYPILGEQCKKSYDKINHSPGNKKARALSFKSRKSVLKIFRQALLCNGMNNATSIMQERFISAEDGHLEALENLNTQIINLDGHNPNPVYTKQDLQKLTINKQQCK